ERPAGDRMALDEVARHPHALRPLAGKHAHDRAHVPDPSARGELRSGLFDVDDLASAIGAAVRTGPVAQRRFTALRARDDVRRGERVVRPALVALRSRRAAFRYGHPAILLRAGSLVARERAQRRQARIGGDAGRTPARAGVEVGTTARAEPATGLATQRP